MISIHRAATNENAARPRAALSGETKSEMHEHSTHLDHVEQRLLAYQLGDRTVYIQWSELLRRLRSQQLRAGVDEKFSGQLRARNSSQQIRRRRE